MSISSEKLYTKPGSKEEAEIQRAEDAAYREDIGSSDEEMKYRPRSRRTGAKKGKGKKIAIVLLLTGGLVAGSIFGTKAFYSHQETRRVDSLIAEYQTDDYVVFPKQITSDRSYDITYADGEKLAKRLVDNNINYVNINGQFYTPEGIDVAIITYNVQYITQVDAIEIQNEGQKMYMAPNGYILQGKYAYKVIQETKTKVVPVCDDYSYITFPGASDWQMVGEPIIVTTLPYDTISNSTLICDVPDGSVLNSNNEVTATLDLAPKKR